MQRRALRRRARIAADQVQLRHRHVERRLARVGEVQELGHPLAEVEVHQPLVAADAVLRMDHRIARLELRQVADQAVDLRRLAAAAAGGVAHEAGKQFALGDQHQVAGAAAKAAQHRSDAEHDRFVARDELCPALEYRQAQSVLGEQFAEGLAPAWRFREDRPPLASCRDRATAPRAHP